MRDLGFDVGFQSGTADDLIFRIRTGSNYTAKELLADKIVGVLPGKFVALLAAAKGSEQQLHLTERSRDVIEMSVSGAVISENWQVASILNLLDGETFLGKLDDDPFITNVDISAHWSMSRSQLYEDLEAYAASCRETMTGYLPDSFEVGRYTGHNWPEDASEYMFKVMMTCAPKIPSGMEKEIKTYFDQMDSALAGSAFEISTSPEEWFEDSVVPYPVAVDIKGNTISYMIEMPPTDLSPGLLLVIQALKIRYGITVRTWSFEITEGW